MPKVPELLAFGGPKLAEKLGEPTISSNIVGSISKYFVERYGFNPSCSVIAFSGDNPCSLVGLRLKEDQIGVSLGTSDTIFGATRQLSPNANEGHVFCNPGDPSGYMVLLCFKNGSLTREHIRNQSCAGSWKTFSDALSSTPTGNGGKIGIYYLEPEITPPGKPGIFRFDAEGNLVNQPFRPDEEARAVVEGQCLSMLVHSRKLGLSVKSIIATGARLPPKIKSRSSPLISTRF
jgi:xylulokinase